MLDAFIIEELRRREQAEHSRYEQPHLEIPVEPPRHQYPSSRDEAKPAKPTDRGVIVIDY